MRRRVRGLALLLSLVAMGPGMATAQSAADLSDVTVDDLVTRALRESPDLQAARAELEAARGRVVQAGLRPNPMLDLAGQKAISPDNNLLSRSPDGADPGAPNLSPRNPEDEA
jgi:outer membrane protein TolC